jgi:predicted nucleic acid-binding protein
MKKSRKNQINIIVDTNIIFSCLTGSNNKIENIIFKSGKLFNFYSCNYMRFEIDKHWGKLKKTSKLDDFDLNEAKYYLFKKIKFINEEIIPEKTWLKSEQLLSGIDLDDIDFLALTLHMNGYLWTRDKILSKGLKNKKFNKILMTQDVELLIQSSLKK